MEGSSAWKEGEGIFLVWLKNWTYIAQISHEPNPCVQWGFSAILPCQDAGACLSRFVHLDKSNREY